MKRNESKNKTKSFERERDGGTKRKRRRRRRDGARRTRQEPLLGAVPVLCPSPFSWPFSSSISSWFVFFSAFVLFLFDFLLFFSVPSVRCSSSFLLYCFDHACCCSARMTLLRLLVLSILSF